jgi:putative hydrolase of the HAD superfamily
MPQNSVVKAIFFDLGDTLITKDKGWVPGAKSVLADLRKRGLRLGLISNTGDWDRAELLQHVPPDFSFNLFEKVLVILSSEVHVVKPDPEIFRRAIKAAALPPGACLFCGEDLTETLAAQQVGLRAARVQAPPNSDIESLVEKLKAAGFLV